MMTIRVILPLFIALAACSCESVDEQGFPAEVGGLAIGQILDKSVPEHLVADTIKRVTAPGGPNDTWVLVGPLTIKLDDIKDVVIKPHVQWMLNNSNFEIEQVAVYRVVDGRIVSYSYLSSKYSMKADTMVIVGGESFDCLYSSSGLVWIEGKN